MKTAQQGSRPSAASIVGEKVRQINLSGRAHARPIRSEVETDPATESFSALGVYLSLLRFPDVLERVPLGRTALYELIKAGKFPAPVKLGGASAWVDVEITRWIENLMLARDRRIADRNMPRSLATSARLSAKSTGMDTTVSAA